MPETSARDGGAETAFHQDAGKTQSGQAYVAIRRMILEWDLEPGRSIDDKSLMGRLKMGRTPIREALLRLSEQGLVVFSPNREIRVAPLDLPVIKELYEVRLQIDRLAGRLFLAGASDKERDDVISTFDTVEALIVRGEHRAVFDLDFHFHRLIIGGAHNSFLAMTHANLAAHFFRIAYLTYYLNDTPTADVMRGLAASHMPIVEAIRAGDEQALDDAITQHTVLSCDYVLEVMSAHRLGRVSELSMHRLSEAVRAASGARPG